MTEDFHKADTQLDELEVSIDDEVPWESFAEACHPQAKVPGLGGEWTEIMWRDYVGIVVDSITITFWRDAIPER